MNRNWLRHLKRQTKMKMQNALSVKIKTCSAYVTFVVRDLVLSFEYESRFVVKSQTLGKKFSHKKIWNLILRIWESKWADFTEFNFANWQIFTHQKSQKSLKKKWIFTCVAKFNSAKVSFLKILNFQIYDF